MELDFSDYLLCKCCDSNRYVLLSLDRDIFWTIFVYILIGNYDNIQ